MREQAQYMNTPKRMLDYLKSSPMAQRAFDCQGEERVRQNIDCLFQRCSEITQLEPDALLDPLDFQPNSREDEEWLAALFAVMRTIILLRERLDFEEIISLKRKVEGPEADLKATRRGVTYAIEVCRTKETKPLDYSSELGERIAKRYCGNKKEEGKKKQLRSTMEKHGCSRAILVSVFDSFSCDLYVYQTFTGQPLQSLREAAEYAFAGMGLPDNTHVLIFTSANGNESNEEDQHWAIEPALPD